MSDIARPAPAGTTFGRLAGNSQIVLLAILVLLCIAISIGAPQFYSVENLVAILRQCSLVLIVAAGMTMLLIAAEVDLSVGASLAFCGVVAMDVTNKTGSVFLGASAGILFGGAGRAVQRPRRHPPQSQFADRDDRDHDDPAGQRLPLFARGGAEPAPAARLHRNQHRLHRPGPDPGHHRRGAFSSPPTSCCGARRSAATSMPSAPTSGRRGSRACGRSG